MQWHRSSHKKAKFSAQAAAAALEALVNRTRKKHRPFGHFQRVTAWQWAKSLLLLHYCDSDLSAAVCSAGKAQALTRLTNHGPTPSLPFGSVVRPAPAPPRRQRSYSPSPPSPVASSPRPHPPQLCCAPVRCTVHATPVSSSFLIPPSVASAAPLQTRRSHYRHHAVFNRRRRGPARRMLFACPAAAHRCSHKRAASSVWIDVEACDVVVGKQPRRQPC